MKTKIDYEKIVLRWADIDFDLYVDDLSSGDNKGLSDKTCKVRCASTSRVLTLLVERSCTVGLSRTLESKP